MQLWERKLCEDIKRKLDTFPDLRNMPLDYDMRHLHYLFHQEIWPRESCVGCGKIGKFLCVDCKAFQDAVEKRVRKLRSTIEGKFAAVP